jgi:hypothetical protein
MLKRDSRFFSTCHHDIVEKFKLSTRYRGYFEVIPRILVGWG